MKTIPTRLLTIITCLSMLIPQNHVIRAFAEEFSETEQEMSTSLTDDSEQSSYITDDDEFLATDELEITAEEYLPPDDDIYIDEDIFAAIDDEPISEIAADNGLPGDWDKAMHFVIRHWHSEPVYGTTFQNASEINVDANRYFVVLEGYIVPDTNPDPANRFNPEEGDKYKFYLVYQDDVTTNGGHQKGEIEQIRVDGTFVSTGAYVLNIDQREGVITLKAYPTENEHFSGLSISAGRRAINQTDANGGTGNAIEIKYDQYTHLVKGHMFYIHDFDTVAGSDEDSVFGTSEEADPEIDTAIVSGNKYYRTTEGLHTDKTASANANGDNRTFDIDLEAWYSEGKMAQIGMVLDASGSMAFTSDRTTVIDIDDLPDKIREQLEYKRGALAKEITKTASGEYMYPQHENMIGYYAFNQNSDDLKRDWFLNNLKSAAHTSNDSDYAKLVNYGADSDVIDFQTGQQTIKDAQTDVGGIYSGGWGKVPMNFDATNGLNLARTTSALVLEESSKGDFTVSFSLMKNAESHPNKTAEILYIGALTGKRSDGKFFHVVYSDNKVIAKQGDNGKVIASFDLKDTAMKYISYVFKKNDSADTYTVTAYLGGKQIGVYRDLKLSGSNIVFSPFADNYSSSDSSTKYKLFVDNVYSYSAALSGDEVRELISLRSANVDINKIDTEEITWLGRVFLTPDEVELLLSPHNTDNTILGVGGYSYFVYDRRASTAEYAPLAYWDGVNAETISGNVNVAKTGDGSVLGQYYNTLTTEEGKKGWYYLTHGSSITNDYELNKLMTAKRLVALGKSYNNNGTINTVKDDVGAEGVPRDQTDRELKSGDTGAEFSSDTYMTIPFYIDENGHLRCFYTSNTSAESIVNGSAYSSYVYELADKNYVKTESLQRALSLFVTELDEKSPESKVAAVRFSAPNFSANDLLSHLVMLDWTNNSSESAAIMNIRRGDRSTTGIDTSAGGLEQYNYGLTGSTSTVTGLEAFKKYLIDNNNLYDPDQDKYLIIFTDGLDTDLSSNTNADRYYGDLTLTKEEDVDKLRQRIRGEIALKDKNIEALDVYKKAKELKESGYTIFTVMLAGGPIVEGAPDYIRAKTLLEELSGSKDSNPKEAEGKYYFSTVYEEKKKRAEIKVNFAIADMLSDSRSDEGKREYLKSFIRYECVDTFAEFIHQYYQTEFEDTVFEKYPNRLTYYIREYHENRFNDVLFDKYLSDCFDFILKSYPEDAGKLILDEYFDQLEELIINDNPDIFKGMTDDQKSEKADELINKMSNEEIIEAFCNSDLAKKVASKILKNMNMRGRSEAAEKIITELQLNDDDLNKLASIALNTLTSWEKSEVADDIINELDGDKLADIADTLILKNNHDINVVIELIINALPDEDKAKLANDILSEITPEEEQRLEDKVDKEYVENVNSADLLARIFTSEILSLIVHSKDSYTIKDYIDPRFDLVEEDGTIWQLKANGIVTKIYPADKNMPDETFKVKRAHAFTSADQLPFDVPYLSYDSENDMYYLKWKDQTIPSCRVGAETLRVWHGKITLRAKNDFIGGNGVLTNGNEENMNWVYFEDAPHKSSGTDDMKGEYPSKGFPRTIVNVSPPTSTAVRTSTIYMGEELSLDEIIQELMSIDTSDSDGSLSTALYWEYLQRYAYSSNSTNYGTLKKILELLKPKETDTVGCFVLPYYYLPDDPEDPDNQTGSKDITDGTLHTGDCLGYLIYTWEPGSRQYPSNGIVKDTISRQSKLTVTFVPFNVNGRTKNGNVTADDLISSYIENSGSTLNIETIKERLNAAIDISYTCPDLNGTLVKDESYKWNKEYKPVVGASVPMQTTIDDSMTKNIVSGEVALQMEIDKDVINDLLDKNALKVGNTIKYTADLCRDGKKIGTFTAEYEISGKLTSDPVVYASLTLTKNFIEEYGSNQNDDGSHKKGSEYKPPTYGLPLGTYTLTNPTLSEYNGLEFSEIESVEINTENQDQFSANDDILRSLLYFDADGVTLNSGTTPAFKNYPAPTECNAVATAYLGMREHTDEDYLNDRYALFTVKIVAGDYESPEYELPETGGSGTDSIVFTGFLMILTAVGMMIFIRARRRYRRADVR